MPPDGQSTLYSSSIEMVTTPETYPLWRTKTPVIVVVGNNAKQASDGSAEGGTAIKQESAKDFRYIHHRYRYMVVTPGADSSTQEADSDNAGNGSGSSKLSMLSLDRNKSIDEGEESFMEEYVIPVDEPTTSNTSNDVEGFTSVMVWEDPFTSIEKNLRQKSTQSLVSYKTEQTNIRCAKRQLENLPFRTLIVDTSASGNEEAISSGNGEEKLDGIRVDTWNNPNDIAFMPYTERETIRKKLTANRSSSGFLSSSSRASSRNSLSSTDSGSAQPSTKKPRLFLVCFHLPISLSYSSDGTWKASWSESLLSKTEHGDVAQTHDMHFVGTVTYPSSDSSEDSNNFFSESDKSQIEKILEPMNCTPLFLEKDLMEAHYLGMCKQVLWPAFHNIDLLDLSTSGWGQREHKLAKEGEEKDQNRMHDTTNVRSTIESDWDQSRLDKWWEAYTIVNQAFANALSDKTNKGCTVWVHDYHLSLLPKLLDTSEQARYGTRTSKMVFFLHIPFPTSQIFRELECGEAILEGMLHADVLGFHAFDHARHFLNAAKRILGLNYESLVGGLIGVQYRGKTVLVTMSNVSIETNLVDDVVNSQKVHSGTVGLQNRHLGRSIIAGVDIAQRLSGITFKLLAFERLLTDYPVWQSKVVMVQRCLIPRSRAADEANTIREVRFLIRRIQEKFGRSVVDYQEVYGSSLPIEERLSLWRAADCLMLTPVREGLNLLPMEYVYARKAPLKPGVTIASEFSAVCSILNGALRVNPFDIQATATCIDKALTMELHDKEGRRGRDIDFVSNFPRDKWTTNVLRDLNEATMNISNNEDNDSVVSAENRVDGGGSEAVDIMNTAKFLDREKEIAFTHLDFDAVHAAYKASKHRVIILDFNGTIVIKEPPGKYLKREILGTSGLKPPRSVIQALAKMTSDPRNTIFVVSGDSQENVENAIGHVSGLGLAASNGACFSNPPVTNRNWQTLELGVDWEAVKRVSLPVLSKYTARTNGSFVKLTHSSIGWSYYSCDPEWGSLQATHLVMELESELSAFDVRFVTLKGIVEIVPRRLNKGLIVRKVLTDAASSSDVDFILCMGDDISDEKMFTSVMSFVADTEQGGSSSPDHPARSNEMEDIMAIDSSIPENSSASGMSTAKNSNDPMYCYTVTVGKKTSHASRYVEDARDVANLLITMSGGDVKNDRSSSLDADETTRFDLFA